MTSQLRHLAHEAYGSSAPSGISWSQFSPDDLPKSHSEGMRLAQALHYQDIGEVYNHMREKYHAAVGKGGRGLVKRVLRQIELVCVLCGAQYLGTKRNRMYCSDCQHEQRTAIMKAQYQKRKAKATEGAA